MHQCNVNVFLFFFLDIIVLAEYDERQNEDLIIFPSSTDDNFLLKLANWKTIEETFLFYNVFQPEGVG